MLTVALKRFLFIVAVAVIAHYTSGIAKSHCFYGNATAVSTTVILLIDCCFLSKKICHNCQLVADSVASLTDSLLFQAAWCAGTGASSIATL